VPAPKASDGPRQVAARPRGAAPDALQQPLPKAKAAQTAVAMAELLRG